MTYCADDQILMLGDCGREPLPDEYAIPTQPAEILEALEVCRQTLTDAVLSGTDDTIGALATGDVVEVDSAMKRDWPYYVALAFIDTLRRELDADSNRFHFAVYPTSGFGVIHVDLGYHPGHSDHDKVTAEIEEVSVDEQVAGIERMLERNKCSIDKQVDQLAALLAEPDTPDRQYRIDAKNQAIDGLNRLRASMQHKLEQLRRDGDVGEG